MALIHEKESARYKFVTEEKADGATFTPDCLADFVAEQILATLRSPNGTTLRVLDPAVGEGSLLISLLNCLSARGYHRIEVHGFETNADSLSVAETRLRSKYPQIPLHFRLGDFLEFACKQSGELPLFSQNHSAERFDVIIANPPYVRTQIMGAASAQSLASGFGLSGRVDLYHAFVLAMIQVLDENGVAGIIVSNRFMTTKSGSVVRKTIRQSKTLKQVWDLGDTKIFDAAVLPAVMILAKSESDTCVKPPFTSIYEADSVAPSTRNVDDVIAALTAPGMVSVRDGRCFQVTHGTLDLSTPIDAVWRVATEQADAWLATVENHTWRTFGALGSIRVGIKTCADKVFNRLDWHDFAESDRPELLRPLMTHHVGRRFKADTTKSGRQVLYPHLAKSGQREPADLSKYPRTAKYLEQHRSVLERRSYVMEAGRRWYEIWVPQDPEAWALPKLVFRDICEAPTFWIDLDGSVVNGDCYWMTLSSGLDVDLLWLALAVANSSFIEAFYDHRFHNKLYSGRRRFITQYVEAFPLPEPTRNESMELISLAKRVYELLPSSPTASVEAELDRLVWKVFGVGQSKKSAGNGI